MGEDGGGGSLNDPDVMNDGLLSLNIHRLRDLLPTFLQRSQKNHVGSVLLPFSFVMLAACQFLGMGMPFCQSVGPSDHHFGPDCDISTTAG